MNHLPRVVALGLGERRMFCGLCEKGSESFNSERGLSMHMLRAHPEEWNEIKVKKIMQERDPDPAWSRLCKVMNAEIQKRLPYKLLIGTIKKRRLLPESKARVEQLCADIIINPKSTKFKRKDLAWNLAKLLYGRSVESVEAKLLTVKEFGAGAEVMQEDDNEVSETDEVNLTAEERWIDQVIQSTPNAKKVLAEDRASVARTESRSEMRGTKKRSRSADDSLDLLESNPRAGAVSTASQTEQVLVECELPETLLTSHDPRASSEEGELNEVDLMEIASNIPSCESSMLGIGCRLRSSLDEDTHKSCEITTKTGEKKMAGRNSRRNKNKNKEVIKNRVKEPIKDTSKTSRTKAKVERGAIDRIQALEVRMDRALAKINSTLQALARSGLRPISEKGMNPKRSPRTTHGGRYEVKFNAQRFGNDRRDWPVERPFESKKHSEAKAKAKKGRRNKPVDIPKPRPSDRQLRSVNGWEKVRGQKAPPPKTGRKTRECSQCPVHCMNRFAAQGEVRDTVRERNVKPAAKASYKEALLRKAEDIVGKKPKKGLNPRNRKAVYASTQRGWVKDRAKLDGRDPVVINDPMEDLMNDATIEEVRAAIPKDNTSPGPDGITLSDIKKLDITSLTRWINKFITERKIDRELLVGKVTLIPKKVNPALAKDYRPITVTSMITRTFHRLLAKRMMALLSPAYQKAYRSVDGTSENLCVLQGVLEDARTSIRPLSIALVKTTQQVVSNGDRTKVRCISSILFLRNKSHPTLNKVYWQPITPLTEPRRVLQLMGLSLQCGINLFTFIFCQPDLDCKEGRLSSTDGGCEEIFPPFPDRRLYPHRFRNITTRSLETVPPALEDPLPRGSLCFFRFRTILLVVLSWFALRQERFTLTCSFNANDSFASFTLSQTDLYNRMNDLTRRPLYYDLRQGAKDVRHVDASNTTRSLIKPSAPLSERKQRLHGAKRMRVPYWSFPYGNRVKFSLPIPFCAWSPPSPFGALETEVWKAVVHKRGRLSICRTCGSAPPTVRACASTKALKEDGWFVEQEQVVGAEFGFVLSPDLMAVKGNVAPIINPAIIGDLLSLDRVYRARIRNLRGTYYKRSIFDWKAMLGQPVGTLLWKQVNILWFQYRMWQDCMGNESDDLVSNRGGLKRRDPGGVRYQVERWTTPEKSQIAALIVTNPSYSTSAMLEALVSLTVCNTMTTMQDREVWRMYRAGKPSWIARPIGKLWGCHSLQNASGVTKNTWCVACKRSNVKTKECKESMVLKLRAKVRPAKGTVKDLCCVGGEGLGCRADGVSLKELRKLCRNNCKTKHIIVSDKRQLHISMDTNKLASNMISASVTSAKTLLRIPGGIIQSFKRIVALSTLFKTSTLKMENKSLN
ncbi:unnamed protein product [Lepeophtheirus salmonis]|uniref:(salmon louse) hypothetical protein n=1 Tax=Lepeophtheirus salmonis TaxID=72036 RepID=A0A7R8D826_LEPSM|nr:unnamed protein product [Lepeophtheirus salmonis]CAF3031865.1 unnamed protein product [Lepeophtheirus salmonis]